MNTTLINELDTTTARFLDLAASIKQENFNLIPFSGSWTAAQVTAHIFKSDSAILKVLYGKTQPTTRPTDERVDELKTLFLDFGNKLNSPEELIPGRAHYQQDAILKSVSSTRAEIREACCTLNLSATCKAALLGEITRLELFHFIIYHTQRHIRQLENILPALKRQ